MADELVPGLNANAIMSGMDGITTAILWIIAIAIVGGILYMVMFYMQFKIRTVIRETANGRTIINTKEKARVFRNKNGVPMWQFWGSTFKFKKINVPIPESSYIDIDSKGRKFCEFFKTPDGNHIPVRADPNKLGEIEFMPFNTEQRNALVMEYRESEAYKRKKWSDTLLQMAPYIIILLILVVFMIFYNDTVAPTIKLGEQNVKISEQNMEIQKQNSLVIRELAGVLNRVDPKYLSNLMASENMTIDGVQVVQLKPQIK
jgi:hypothetical protein